MSSETPAPAATGILPTLFADGVLEAHVRNGVARVTLGQAMSDGRGVPTGQLVIPVSQLPVVLSSLARLAQEVEARTRQAAAANTTPAPGPASGPAPEAPIPGAAFRFS